jgi:hypothetical protein
MTYTKCNLAFLTIFFKHSVYLITRQDACLRERGVESSLKGRIDKLKICCSSDQKLIFLLKISLILDFICTIHII